MNKSLFDGAYFAFELEDSYFELTEEILTIHQAIDGELLERYNKLASASYIFGAEKINNRALNYLKHLKLTRIYSFHDGTGIKTFESLFPDFKLVREEYDGDRVKLYHGLSPHYWKEFFEEAGIKLIFIDDLISNSSKKNYICPKITKRDLLTEEITF